MRSTEASPSNHGETNSAAGDKDSWSKIAEEAPPFGKKINSDSDNSAQDQHNNESDVSGLPIRTFEEADKEWRDKLKRELSLFDKYDYTQQTEESLSDLLDSTSTPSPTLDSESLIENVIWVNRRKLSRTDLSKEEREDIEQKIKEAEEAKTLFEGGEEKKAELKRQMAYYDLPPSERTSDMWEKLHGRMTEDEKRTACFESPTLESAAEFTKTILDRIDVRTLDKIIEAKKTGDKQVLVDEITTRLAFMTQFDNQRPVVEYINFENGNDEGCHNYLGYGIDKITLDKKLLTDAYDMDYVIMTVGHEMFHAYQNTLMRNAEDTDKKAQAYKYNLEHYISAENQEDYWKYHNQLVEIEAFCFGEQFRDLVSSRERYLYERDKPKGLLDRLNRILKRKK